MTLQGNWFVRRKYVPYVSKVVQHGVFLSFFGGRIDWLMAGSADAPWNRKWPHSTLWQKFEEKVARYLSKRNII